MDNRSYERSFAELEFLESPFQKSLHYLRFIVFGCFALSFFLGLVSGVLVLKDFRSFLFGLVFVLSIQLVAHLLFFLKPFGDKILSLQFLVLDFLSFSLLIMYIHDPLLYFYYGFLIVSGLGSVLLRARFAWSLLMVIHASLLFFQIDSFETSVVFELTHQEIFKFFSQHFVLDIVWILFRVVGAERTAILVRKLEVERRLAADSQLKMMGLLTANLCHRLASPLMAAGIRSRGLIGQLQDSHLRDQAVKLEESIQQSFLVLENLEGIKDQEEPLLKKVDLSKAIKICLSEWSHRHASIEIQECIQEGILTAKSQLLITHSLLSLLDNSVEASSSAKIKVQLFKEDTWRILEVADDGPGFESLQSAKSFGGFGLKLVSLFAESVGGRLQIQNLPNRGASVRLSWREV